MKNFLKTMLNCMLLMTRCVQQEVFIRLDHFAFVVTMILIPSCLCVSAISLKDQRSLYNLPGPEVQLFSCMPQVQLSLYLPGLTLFVSASSLGRKEFVSVRGPAKKQENALQCSICQVQLSLICQVQFFLYLPRASLVNLQ